MKELRPPWLLAPYLVWLGLVDWLAEHAGKSDTQVLAETRVELQQNGYVYVKRLGIGAALFGGLVLFVAHLAAPGIETAGRYMPQGIVLPLSAFIGVLTLLAFLGLILWRTYYTLTTLYIRGLKRWAHRQALYEP